MTAVPLVIPPELSYNANPEPPGFPANTNAREPNPLPWEAPVRLTEPARVTSFPIDVLPPALAGLIQEAGAALDCPADFLGPPLLVAAGAAIGTSRVLRVKDNCHERAALYL